jgi:hypothetical protein
LVTGAIESRNADTPVVGDKKAGATDNVRQQAVALLGDFGLASRTGQNAPTDSAVLHIPDITTLTGGSATDSVGGAMPSTRVKTADIAHPAAGSDHSKPTKPHDGRDVHPADKPEPTLDQARARLDDVVARHFANDPTGLADFKKDMAGLEQRMARWPNGSAETQRTYTELADLMDKPSQVVPQKTREQLATQVIHTAAHPETVNQGWSSDCAAATLESRMYTRTPSQAARVVTETALTGSYSTYDGKTITLDRDSITHQQTGIIAPEQAKLGFEERNLSDQIFQCTLRNMYLSDLNQQTGYKMRYSLGTPDADHPYGERVIDYQNPKHPLDVSSMYMGLPENSDVLEHSYRRMSGTTDSGFLSDAGTAVNADEFKQHLQDQLKTGKFPLMAAINSNQEPFKSQMGTPDGQGGLHAITITNYDPRTGTVEYRNPYMGDKPQTMNVDKLFDSMHPIATSADVSDFSNQLTSSTLTDSQLRDAMYTTLKVLGPSQRRDFLDAAEQQSHRDLYHLLTEEQRTELGVDRNLFDRLGRSISHAFENPQPPITHDTGR